jgi:hypothetical protein
MTEEVIVEQPAPTPEAAPDAIAVDAGDADLIAAVADAEGEPAQAKELSLDELPLPEPESDDDPEPAPKRPKSKEDRLLFKKERELARERAEKAELERRLQQQEANRQPVPMQQQDFSDVSRENFNTEEEWVVAVLDKRINHQRAQAEQEEFQRAQHRQQAEFVAKVNEIKDKGASKYSDFDELVEPMFDVRGDFPRNDALAAAIADSDYGDDILYFMGKYKAEGRKIAEMSPVKAIKAIANLEARFKEKRKGAAVKSSTKIIEPLKNVKPGATMASGSLTKMTPSQIEAMDKKEFQALWDKEFPKATHY